MKHLLYKNAEQSTYKFYVLWAIFLCKAVTLETPFKLQVYDILTYIICPYVIIFFFGSLGRNRRRLCDISKVLDLRILIP